MDNVVLLAHVGSSSLHTWQDMGQLVLDNLVSKLPWEAHYRHGCRWSMLSKKVPG
jgi:lactate dehydrogenase-like 2-hydroxyacid dehydrogenase